LALLGAVANCGNPGLDGTPLSHQLFHPDADHGQTPPVTTGGYLYLFANGCRKRYDNYFGSIEIRIRRVQ
ncbi:MAG: hypothetical protein PHQ27_09490, partial [Victivallales bacterium]|nr:hypothetical protein [Victivallales bacterium]